MPLQDIVELIDQEILQLQRARTLLAGDTVVAEPSNRRGRPKGSTNRPQVPTAPQAKKATKRIMSEEGKARIAAAQKARWAKQKKAAAAPKKAAITSRFAPAKKAAKPASKKVAAKKIATAKKNVAPAKLAFGVESGSSSVETFAT